MNDYKNVIDASKMQEYNVEINFKTPPKFSDKLVIQNKVKISETNNEGAIQSFLQENDESKQENLRIIELDH